MAQQTWFITGISSGFGRCLSGLLLERGYRVAGTVRTHDAVTDLQERHPELQDRIVDAFQAKVIGPLLVAKHLPPKMVAGGSMVLFFGVAAWRPAAPYSVMAITNGAVQFTASALARELARFG